MASVPSTKTLLKDQNISLFLGQAGNLLVYPCAQGRFFSIVAPSHRPFDKEAHDSYNPEIDPIELVTAYKHFSSPVPELLRQVKKCVKWTVVCLPLLSTYSSENARVVLLGDAG